MDERGTIPSRPRRTHLHSAKRLTGAVDSRSDVDLTRRHGQGNGLRIHGIYFAAVSLAAFVLVVIGIAVATTRM